MIMDNQKKRVFALTLVTKCPFIMERDDCPLREVREAPLNKRMDLINAMSDEEIDIVVEHHTQCFMERVLEEPLGG